MDPALNHYVLLTGSNLGNRHALLQRAAERVDALVGRIMRSSNIHESEPWGFESEHLFLNQALLIETALEPLEMLARTQQIETELGRVRGQQQWSSRHIDIDILCSPNTVHRSPELVIPHSQLHLRQFALRPLCEVAAEWMHPVFNRTYGQLLEELIGQRSNIELQHATTE